MTKRPCRFCGNELTFTFADLGVSPLSNSFLKPAQLREMEPFYPLHAFVCHGCFLVQLEEFQSPQEIFNDYAYFSSYSETWLAHCETYARSMVHRFGLGKDSLVVELASNDGYLLQFFKQFHVPVLGIEPAKNVATVAQQKGIPTRVCFFGSEMAQELRKEGITADLLVGNNVLAHVPDLNGFVGGMHTILSRDGVISMEFPHLLSLFKQNQFDTIYHEHFSYFSFLAVDKIFKAHRLHIFDVEQIPTHGGSLRIFVGLEDSDRVPSVRIAELLELEVAAGLNQIDSYGRFRDQVQIIKCDLLRFLIDAKRAGHSVAAYGAPAKGNTLLNFCGVRTDFIKFTVDLSPHKQGLFLPGTHIPIFAPEALRKHRPDYVFILPWNLRDEISQQVSFIREWGGKFVVPIPELEVF